MYTTVTSLIFALTTAKSLHLQLYKAHDVFNGGHYTSPLKPADDYLYTVGVKTSLGAGDFLLSMGNSDIYIYSEKYPESLNQTTHEKNSTSTGISLHSVEATDTVCLGDLCLDNMTVQMVDKIHSSDWK